MNQPINTQIKEMLEVVEDIKNTIGLSGVEAFNFYRQAVIGTDKVENKEDDLELLINKFVKHDKKIERLADEMEEFRKLVLDKLDKLDERPKSNHSNIASGTLVGKAITSTSLKDSANNITI